jgi:purine-cytosine permease-like protein
MTYLLKESPLRDSGYAPEAERLASPGGLFGILVGAQMCFNLVVLGWLPIRFGLGLPSSLSAIATGLLTGCLGAGPFALLGTRTGANSTVSSGAHFGLRGRLIGTAITFFIALGFFALVIWTGGDAITGGIVRAFHIKDTNLIRTIGYILTGVGATSIAIFGHDKVAATQKFVAVGIGLLFVMGFVALMPNFHIGYRGGNYILGSFWPTWFMSAATALAVPVSYTPFVNDYSRYISLKRYSRFAVSLASGGGLFVGCMAVMSFGVFEGSIFNVQLGPIRGLVEGCPPWYLFPIIIIGVVGPLSHGSLCLYAPGLDISTLFPTVSRRVVTLALGALGLVVVLLGAFVWNAVDAFIAFVTLFTVATTPWIVINMMGHFHRRGWYSSGELQLMKLSAHSSRYWFSGGWNLRAITAWVPAVAVGLLLSKTSLFTGAWYAIASGIDISVPVAAVTGGTVYAFLLVLLPEHSTLHGYHSETPGGRDVPETGFGTLSGDAGPVAEN